MSRLFPSLAKAVASGQVSHSWLLTGNETVLEEQALSLAQALLCTDLLPTGEACCNCAVCHQVLAGNSADLQIIRPDGQSVKISQTRKLQHYAALESYSGGKQVIVIFGAHTMQVVAANSLLKILEEPPNNVYFILTAPVGDSLLPTILSRCTWVRLPQKAEDDVIIEDNIEQQKRAIDFLGKLKNDPSSLLLFSQSFKDDKKGGLSARASVRIFLQELLGLFRDMAVADLTLAGESLMKNKFMPICNGNTALKAALEIEHSQSLLEQNINITLLLDVLFLRLQDLVKKQV